MARERKGSARHGFVYLMTNASMPGLLKIGSTDRPPHIRRSELSASTSVPTPFDLLAYVESKSMFVLERDAHDYFMEDRSAKTREFFNVSPALAAAFIASHHTSLAFADSYEGGVLIDRDVYSCGAPGLESLVALTKLPYAQAKRKYLAMVDAKRKIWMSEA